MGPDTRVGEKRLVKHIAGGTLMNRLGEKKVINILEVGGLQ